MILIICLSFWHLRRTLLKTIILEKAEKKKNCVCILLWVRWCLLGNSNEQIIVSTYRQYPGHYWILSRSQWSASEWPKSMWQWLSWNGSSKAYELSFVIAINEDFCLHHNAPFQWLLKIIFTQKHVNFFLYLLLDKEMQIMLESTSGLSLSGETGDTCAWLLALPSTRVIKISFFSLLWIIFWIFNPQSNWGWIMLFFLVMCQN